MGGHGITPSLCLLPAGRAASVLLSCVLAPQVHGHMCCKLLTLIAAG
jgi:hypothetical protein